MSIKVRCSRCAKRISIDEAFAGGVCRCPYCTAINNVPGGHLAGGRSPSRAATPVRKAASRVEAAGQQRDADIPVADRVVLQGVAGIVLLVALLALVAGGVFIGVKIVGSENGKPHDGRPAAQSNPFVPAGRAMVAGDIAVQTPVVYVLDASRSMQAAYTYAGRMIDASLASLPAGARAGVVVGAEEAATGISGGYVTMPAGRAAASQFIESVRPAGGADIAEALEAALALSPRTIVLLTRQYVDDPSLLALADRAKQRGVVIIVIVPGDRADMAEGASNLAKRTGGESRAYSLDQLREWASQAGGAD